MYLEVIGLSKFTNNTRIIDDISFRFMGGKIYCVKGEAGSGKTMLMRCICGLVRPSKGEININGEILGKDIDSLRSIGSLIERPAFIDNLTAYENLKFIASINGNINNEDIMDAVRKVGLISEISKKLIEYSDEMKQKLGIACAIMGLPDIIILDEPFKYINEEDRKRIIDMIKKIKDNNKIIIVTCNNNQDLSDLYDELIYL